MPKINFAQKLQSFDVNASKVKPIFHKARIGSMMIDILELVTRYHSLEKKYFLPGYLILRKIFFNKKVLISCIFKLKGNPAELSIKLKAHLRLRGKIL